MLPKLLKLTEMTSLWRLWKDFHPFKQILGRLSQKSKLSRLKRKRRVMRSLMMSHLFREKKPTGKARPLLRMDPGNSGERKKRLQLETFLSQTKKQLQVQEQPWLWSLSLLWFAASSQSLRERRSLRRQGEHLLELEIVSEEWLGLTQTKMMESHRHQRPRQRSKRWPRLMLPTRMKRSSLTICSLSSTKKETRGSKRRLMIQSKDSQASKKRTLDTKIEFLIWIMSVFILYK